MAKKVLVAMSGGVDSSVAALLLQQQGYQVSGATLKLFDSAGAEKATRTCCSLDDVLDARQVAARLDFPHYVFNFSSDFRRDVMERFANGYARGETPNPCIDCNRYIKFSRFLERAQLMKQDYMATGHYARIEQDSQSGRWLLKKALDNSKDQTYALYAMSQRELAHTLFPLGEYRKNDARELAEKHGLINARKPDSQDICFVPNGDYTAFLENTMGLKNPSGSFVDSQGNVIAPHQGFLRYTVGQRRGLHLAAGKPLYVVEKKPETGDIVVGGEQSLYAHGLIAEDVHLIALEGLNKPIEAQVKIRYRQQEVPAVLSPHGDSKIKVMFLKPQRAVTPGQAVVFYQGEVVLGGATIKRAVNSHAVPL